MLYHISLKTFKSFFAVKLETNVTDFCLVFLFLFVLNINVKYGKNVDRTSTESALHYPRIFLRPRLRTGLKTRSRVGKTIHSALSTNYNF